MPNNSYRRSANRERAIKAVLEKDGYYAVRAAGSHGNADVIAIRPAIDCANGFHYEVRFIQVKTNKQVKKFFTAYKVEESPCGMINVEYWNFPSMKRAKGAK